MKHTYILIVALIASAQLVRSTDIHEKKEILTKKAVSAAPKVSGAPSSQNLTEQVKELLSTTTTQIAAPVVPSQCESVYSLVSSTPDFSILKAAIDAASLTSVFDSPALVSTVFAPTDAAFTKALDKLDITPQELFNDPLTLAIVLKYHVIPGLSLPKALLKDGQIYPTLLVDLKGQKLTVEFNADKVIRKTGVSYEYAVIPSAGKPVLIDEFDVNAGCPSVVHVIDGVLIPAYKDAKLVGSAGVAYSALLAYESATASPEL